MLLSPSPAAAAPKALQDLTAEFAALQQALRGAYQQPNPDLAVIRDLRTQVVGCRARIARLEGEPPPHTD
jgi:hypothetical protein